ncbi:MAG: DUF2520 domain-containing protein, partial [Flavobacterium sp.]
MKVVIIGSGNVATHFALAFFEADVEVSQIWSNNYDNAIQLANKVNADAIEDLSNIDNNADLCLVAVKDDAISEIGKKLNNFKGIVVHTAGSVSLQVFEHLDNYGVLYPLQTFSKNKSLSFKNIPLCVEANNNESLKAIKNIASKLSKHVEEVSSDKRKVLHLSAVFACNFTNHLYALAADLLVENDLNFDLLRPLITETAHKILT